MQDIEKIKEELKEILSYKRYEHSIGVMEKAKELAKIYNIDMKKAMLTGLTHDIAKEMTSFEMSEYIKKNEINIDEIEMKNPSLLHAPIGADICKKKYDFSEEMIRAIRVHTTGDEKMTLLDKIIFLSDKIEKGRNYNSVEEIRQESLKNLDNAILLFLNENIKIMIKRERIIHPKSILFRNELIISNKE